jgi:predicted kinase
MTQPTLYLMLGYPGAGKTTAADIISELTGAEHLASDIVRLELFPFPKFTDDEHDTLYKTLDERTKALLLDDKNVIYDANLNRFQHRKEKYDICDETGALAVLIWIQTAKDIAKQRAAHKSRAKLWHADETPHAMFDRLVDVFEEPGLDEPFIAMDGTKITSDYVREVLGL